jgi:transcriptional regulator with XRE-family HTH domain
MNLKEWRILNGFPQRKVAAELGKTKQTIHNYEKNGVEGVYNYHAREALEKLSNGKITDFSGSKVKCDTCGDCHEADSLPLSCQSGDGV